METGVEGQEPDSGAVLPWEVAALNNLLDDVSGLLEVTTVDGRLGYIENEEVGRRHGRSVHVLVAGHKVDRATAEFIPIVHVLSDADMVQRGVVVVFSRVDLSAEVANPLHAVVDEPYEGVDVGATLFAADNGLLAKAAGRNGLTGSLVTVGLGYDSERDP